MSLKPPKRKFKLAGVFRYLKTFPFRLSAVFMAFAVLIAVVFFVFMYFWGPTLVDRATVTKMEGQLEEIPGAVTVKKVARVGSEYIFLTDLHAYARVQGKSLDDIDLTKSIRDLCLESSALQAGHSNGWIQLDESVFNNPFKDFPKRWILYNEVARQYRLQKDYSGGDFDRWVSNFQSTLKIEHFEQ